MKSVNSKEQKTMNTASSKDDHAVKISISQEGMESCRKKLQERGIQSADENSETCFRLERNRNGKGFVHVK